MKILLVHNHYGSSAPSGENRVFELERDLLERHGHEVDVFERHNDTLRKSGSWGKFKGALMTPWNPATARLMQKKIASFNPDILHAHNTFPIISPSIFSSAKGVGRVLTLHNYRVVCPNGIPMRAGKICTDCIDRKSILPAVRHGCYRNSRLATFPLATNVALHRAIGTWQKHVDAFVALTSFQKDLMVKAGLPAERIHIKPNFLPGRPERIPFAQRDRRVIFAGRLSAEKGVLDLVKAWLLWGGTAPDLHILGDGPLRKSLNSLTEGVANIHIYGAVKASIAEREIANSQLLILPSRWFEGFPMVLREAIAYGVPIGVSNIGSMPKIASDVGGVIFEPGDANQLLGVVQELWQNYDRLEAISLKCEKIFEKKYNEKVNYKQMIQIYEKARCLVV